MKLNELHTPKTDDTPAFLKKQVAPPLSQREEKAVKRKAYKARMGYSRPKRQAE